MSLHIIQVFIVLHIFSILLYCILLAKFSIIVFVEQFFMYSFQPLTYLPFFFFNLKWVTAILALHWYRELFKTRCWHSCFLFEINGGLLFVKKRLKKRLRCNSSTSQSLKRVSREHDCDLKVQMYNIIIDHDDWLAGLDCLNFSNSEHRNIFRLWVLHPSELGYSRSQQQSFECWYIYLLDQR